MADRFDYDQSDLSDYYDVARGLSRDVIELWMQAIANATGRSGIKKIADVGCGPGRFTAALSQAFSVPVTGIDPSIKQLEVARAKWVENKRVWFEQGDAESFCLCPRADMVFLSMVLHHFSDPETSIGNIGRNLHENGFVALRSATQEDIRHNFLFDAFPEARQIEIGRMMPSEKIIQVFERCGFALYHKQTVEQSFASDPLEYLKKISERGLSALKMIDDLSFQSGMSRLEDTLRGFPADKAVTERYHLLVFRLKEESD